MRTVPKSVESSASLEGAVGYQGQAGVLLRKDQGVRGAKTGLIRAKHSHQFQTLLDDASEFRKGGY